MKSQFTESAALKLRVAEELSDSIGRMAQMMADAVAHGGKLLICGNGGSAADAQHFAAELIGRLARERGAIPAIALTTDTSILTAVANDYSFDNVFKRQVEGLGKPGDILIALSTSGNSENVIRALKSALQMQMKTIALLGKGGGRLATLADEVIVVPSASSQRIQEVHITIVHVWCELIEDILYPN
ncbi:MAG: D-sedoheptulose 7-phosphate isomerase [Calditrichaeota bacterium]|nr:MAG: D-sedoheptulose 7-phosphate isomerase [Calditrichota bacterium]